MPAVEPKIEENSEPVKEVDDTQSDLATIPAVEPKTEGITEPVREEGDTTSTANSVDKNGKQPENASADSDQVKTPTKEDFESGPSLLAQGKRHLYVKDYPSAVATLSEACAKISAAHGQLADDCADGYYFYGCALLELAREEMAVLGEPENKNESDADEDDDDEEAGEETLESSKLNTEEGEISKTEEKGGDEDVKNGNAGDEKDEGGEEKEGEKEDKEGGAEEEEDNVNDLQLAWEMFDLARVIYERQNAERKMADTYLKLGEVAMESENYDCAVSDMNKCLELQQKLFSPDNRAIAETLFQLGVASSLCNQFDESIKYFTNAGVVLERRIRILTSSNKPDPEILKKDPFYTIEKEVEELRALLPEIKDKIADMEDFKSEALKALKENLTKQSSNKDESAAGPSTSAANGSSSSSADPGTSSSSASKAAAPVNNISHLIRKKRKADDITDNNTNESEAKKPNVEVSS